MASLFNISEVFQFAIQIEKNGEIFYKKMAEKLDDESVKHLFNVLAEDEIKHKEKFAEMGESALEFEPENSYTDEYFQYLNAYVDNVVFSEERIDEEIDKMETALDAVKFGMKAETDTILYYQEIKDFVPYKQQEIVDAIIREERKHFFRLSEIAKNL